MSNSYNRKSRRLRLRLVKSLAKEDIGIVSTVVESTAVSITARGHLVIKSMKMVVNNSVKEEGALHVRITAVKKVAALTRVRKLKGSKKILSRIWKKPRDKQKRLNVMTVLFSSIVFH